MCLWQTQDDPEKVRLVYQVDKRNGIAKIFNWEALNPDDNETPTAEPFFVPELQVDGEERRYPSYIQYHRRPVCRR